MTKSREGLFHKGYSGTSEMSWEDECMHGRLLHIDDVVTYGGESMSELKAEFIAAVDRYIEHCASIGKQPNKPYSGSFNVRLGPERHKKLVQETHNHPEKHKSINDVLCCAVDLFFAEKTRPTTKETVVIMRDVVHSETVSVSASAELQFQPFQDKRHAGSQQSKH